MVVSIAIACLPFLPQTACGSPGPDLIIDNINLAANYPVSGGIDAVAFGLTPANVGSEWIDYVATTPAHPVYGLSLYKLKTVDGSTRFEELGQNWLRHGFFALSSNFGCTCEPTDGTHLGIGCADSLSASGQGQAVWLGPRWQVNASTGAFSYPPANPPHPGVNDRRLQVAVADLEPSSGSVRYFAEAQSVAPDDAAADNRDNNSSHREVMVTGSPSDWTFALTGTTQAERPAVYAWQDADPAVVVSDVSVAGDGRFVLASRATDLGGGVWHYEYALHNQSSDRSAGSFRVSLPASATVGSSDFHDVAYHSGDGPGNVDFDGTDWMASVAGGEIAWETVPYSTNPSANALRWSTTYNFRFDVDAPPTTGLVTVGLFKPGSPSDVTISATVPLVGPPPHMSFCFGDGSIGPCPCGNTGSFSRGCQNSASTGGAFLNGLGNASLSADSLVMSSGGELPTALSIVFQGDTPILPANYGDGLRCAGGTIKRLYVKSASGGAVTAPQPGDPSISARSAALGDPISAGQTRYYQTYYRDANPTFCPAPQGSTFNITGAVSVTWLN